MNGIRIVAVALGWLAVLVGVAGVALHWTDWQRRPIVLLASFAPYLMVVAVVGLLVLALARNWIGAAVAGAVVGAAVWTQLPIYVPSGSSTDGQQLTVMQANILFGGADVSVLVDEVTARDVDVLTVNELTPEELTRLMSAGVEDRLPYRYVEPAPGAVGTGIWSRYPLTEQTRYEGFSLNQLSVRAALPAGRSVLVFAFHLIPPVPATQRWADEMQRVREILDAVPSDAGPVVIGADFNATHDHSLYRSLLTGRFDDAGDQSGAGMLATYPADRWWPAFIGIDHILIAGGTADDVRTVPIPGSDHKAVVAVMRLRVGSSS